MEEPQNELSSEKYKVCIQLVKSNQASMFGILSQETTKLTSKSMLRHT